MQNAVTRSAYELALKFTEESSIPERLKKDKPLPKKFQKDSQIEVRFKAIVKSWEYTISEILKGISDKDQAWRFIRITPLISDSSLMSVVKSKDFNTFLEYLIFKRDVQNCGPDELGNLALLHTAFQRELEKAIANE